MHDRELLGVDSHLILGSLPVTEPHLTEDVVELIDLGDLSEEVKVTAFVGRANDRLCKCSLDFLLFIGETHLHIGSWFWLGRYKPLWNTQLVIKDKESLEIVSRPAAKLVDDLHLRWVEAEPRLRAGNRLVRILL